MKKLITAFACAAAVAAALSWTTVNAAGVSCETLASFTLTGKVTTARVVPAGGFTPPGRGGEGGGEAFKRLPAFCRVAATLTPTSDSDIKVEVWLPSAGWNGKFQAVGNGGWAGTISYPAHGRRARARIRRASTDTGHTAATAPASRSVIPRS